MADWLNELWPYFHSGRWQDASENGAVPRALREELLVALGPQYIPDLVYPLDYEDNRVAFLAFAGEESVNLVRFEPRSTTHVTLLGSLTGGVYTESLQYYGDIITATFNHDRLEAPFQVTLRPPGGMPEHSEESKALLERSDLLRERLRRWAAAPHGPAK